MTVETTTSSTKKRRSGDDPADDGVSYLWLARNEGMDPYSSP